MIASTEQRVSEARERPAALPSVKRNCTYCVYSLALPDGEPDKRICVNHIEAPGQLQPVGASETCRNFRAKRRPSVRTEPPAPPSDEIRYIALTQGKFAIVDAADYEWLNQYKWYVSCSSPGMYYACRQSEGRSIMMHRQIMDPPAGHVVDHINRNSLNNRRGNLRVCTQAENVRNCRGRQTSSQYKGVRCRREQNKWQARIGINGRQESIGVFDSEVEAALAYDLRAIVLFGEFAYLNLPHITNATRQAKQLKAQVSRDNTLALT